MLPPIQNLRALVAVAETGQLRRAALRLNVTESAISHQLGKLEAQLGARLVERGRDGARLTPAGEALYRHAAAALREIEAGVAAVAPSQLQTVQVTAPRTVAAMWLAPRLSAFFDAHPDIDLRALATDRECDLVRDGLDLAIRHGGGPWTGYAQEFFCYEEIAPVAAPELAETAARIGWTEATQRLPFLGNDYHASEWRVWGEQTGRASPAPARMRRLGSYDQIQAAAINGLGVAMARTPLCLEALADGRLRRIPDTTSLRSGVYNILRVEGRTLRKAQRVFYDWLMSARPAPMPDA